MPSLWRAVSAPSSKTTFLDPRESRGADGHGCVVLRRLALGIALVEALRLGGGCRGIHLVVLGSVLRGKDKQKKV